MTFKKCLQFGMLLTLIIFFLLGLIFQQFHLRLDLSRDQIFSISSYSRELLGDLDDSVDVSYYLSQGLVSRVPEIQEISDLLFEYRRLSRGNLQLSIINTDNIEAGDENSPEEFGIVPRELQIFEGNEETRTTVYSGIVIKYQDSMEVIPLVLNPEGLEYEISSRILALKRDTRPSLGVLLGGAGAEPRDYQSMIQYLSQYYDLQIYSPGDALPPSADALAVLGFSGLNEGDLFAVEQFILRGKGVIIAAEGTVVDLARNLAPENVSDHPMLEMLNSYGIRIEPGWVLDSQNLEIPVQRQQGRVMVNQYEEYPPWLGLTSSDVHPAHPVTARFQGLDLFWASPLTLSPGLAEEQTTVLLRSSSESVYAPEPVSDPAAAPAMMARAEDQRGEYALAVELSGPLSAYYPSPPDSLTRRGVRYPRLQDSGEDVHVIILGDSDFPGELFQSTGSSYNILFMQNLFEYLMGDEQLMELRSRGRLNMRLDAASSDLEFRRIVSLASFTGLVAVPGLVILYGFFRLIRRKRLSFSRYIPEGRHYPEQGGR